MCLRRIKNLLVPFCLCLLALLGGLYIFDLIFGASTIPSARKDDGIVFQGSHRKAEKLRIVIIGAGPTSLGALYRLRDIGAINFERVQIILLEQTRHPGGLASSNRDDNNFLWDNGGHVVFSHYEYFNTVLNNAIHNWNYRNRSSFVFMRGGDGLRRFIPYPLQNNIHLMDNEFQKASLEGLEMVERLGMPTEPKTVLNFNQWLLNTFGKGLCDIFMIKYNTKVWTVDPAEMNSVWVDERVAVPDIATIKDKIHKQKTKQLKNSGQLRTGCGSGYRK